jgi:hypothetical protein
MQTGSHKKRQRKFLSATEDLLAACGRGIQLLTGGMWLEDVAKEVEPGFA